MIKEHIEWALAQQVAKKDKIPVDDLQLQKITAKLNAHY
jgi:hypothetical protein